MGIGGRSWSTIAHAALSRQHYTAGLNMLRVYRRPGDAYRRYLLGRGTYPTSVEVSTPLGEFAARLQSKDDMLTLNEIFCREDYYADGGDKVVVDFGSNIGLSALYFLTRSSDAFAYLHEPFPQNIPRLKENLAAFKGRYALAEAAVGLEDGEARFGWEATGRYGGIGRETGSYLQVPCLDSNCVLREILSRHAEIDILKIDTEGLEAELTTRIPEDMLARIRKLYVEHDFARNPLPRTHAYSRHGPIARLIRLR
jgi:FkbM family methyltransferase